MRIKVKNREKKGSASGKKRIQSEKELSKLKVIALKRYFDNEQSKAHKKKEQIKEGLKEVLTCFLMFFLFYVLLVITNI